MRKELALANEKLKTNLRGAEENLKNRLEKEKDLLMLEQDHERNAYQKLLKDFHDLEQQNEFLQQKLALHVPGHSRSLSNASSGSGHITSTDLPPDDQNIVNIFILIFRLSILSLFHQVFIIEPLTISFVGPTFSYSRGQQKKTRLRPQCLS